jgi:ribulose-bisphosphate carboxylase large chain
VIRATYLLDPVESAASLAESASVGVPWGSASARAQVADVEPGAGTRGRVTFEFPVEFWGDDLTLLLATVVAGEIMDRADVRECRLVDLDLPDGLLPGPAFDAPDRVMVGAVLEPASGSSPRELGSVAADLVRGGVDVIVDPVALADPPWCPIEDRVAAVGAATPDDVTYFANVTGHAGTVMHRASVAVDMGAGGLIVHAGVQGLDTVRLLREADLGVPVFAPRTGFAPWLRSERFGLAPDTLARLLRLAGADVISCGAIDGSRWGGADDVVAQVAACRRPVHRRSSAQAGAGPDRRPPDPPDVSNDGPKDLPAAVAVLDGGLDPVAARAQVERLGGSGLLVLLDHEAYVHPGGIEAAVRDTVAALEAPSADPASGAERSRPPLP